MTRNNTTKFYVEIELYRDEVEGMSKQQLEDYISSSMIYQNEFLPTFRWAGVNVYPGILNMASQLINYELIWQDAIKEMEDGAMLFVMPGQTDDLPTVASVLVTLLQSGYSKEWLK